jgi:hypothetical protein
VFIQRSVTRGQHKRNDINTAEQSTPPLQPSQQKAAQVWRRSAVCVFTFLSLLSGVPDQEQEAGCESGDTIKVNLSAEILGNIRKKKKTTCVPRNTF